MKKKLGFSNFNLHLHKNNNASKVVISAHGGYAAGNGFFVVPKKIKLHFYCPHGHALKVSGGVWAFLTPKGGHTYKPFKNNLSEEDDKGRLVHNYHLTWFEDSGNIEKGLEQPGADTWNVVTVVKGKQGTLEEVVNQLQRKGGYTDIHCSFCRVDETLDVNYTEKYYTPSGNEEKVHRPFPAYTPSRIIHASDTTMPIKKEWASWEDV